MNEMFKRWAKRLNLDKKDLIAASLAVAIMAVILIDSNFFHNRILEVLLVFDAIALGFTLLVIAILASFAIMGSLLEVAAGLSLLIFLSQSYCAIPTHTSAGDDALKSLVSVGLLYIAFYFFRSLYTSLRGYLQKLQERDKKRSWEKTTTIVLYIIFIFLFVWEIYLVIKPIVNGLCIYHR
ncbi:MAG TPA: hypothetical protein VMR99_00805 [Candidatus Paceibacterota bacterium]|nr:hypothetical protein [Candidatus Paceibacterota bacterium]